MQFPPAVARTACLAAALLCGCGDARLPASLDEAREAVSEKVEQSVEDVERTVKEDLEPGVAQALNLGRIELDLGEPVNVGSCFVRLATFSDNRPAVLQWTSYASASAETFPSVFVRARLGTLAPASLAGQVVSADVYLQTAAGGPLWHSDAPVELQITTADATTIAAKVLSGTLLNADTGARAALKGNMTGALP
jgi:hypothetical protein